jgi:hypothetical protein
MTQKWTKDKTVLGSREGKSNDILMLVLVINQVYKKNGKSMVGCFGDMLEIAQKPYSVLV